MLHLTPLEETVAGRQLIEIGREEGREEGRLVGQVQLLQEILGEAQMTLDVLEALPTEELERIIAELKARLRR